MNNDPVTNASVTNVSVINLIGPIIAAILSWSINHSIGWCIFHAILGWLYVLYYAIFL